MLADRSAPLHTLVRPFLGDIHHAAPDCGASGRNRQSPRVQRHQGDLEAAPFFPQQVLFRDEDVFELDHDVADSTQSHELATVRNLDSRRVHFENECRDLLLLFSVDDFRRRLRHHDDDFRLQTIRAPQLLAVEDPAFAVRRRNGASLHLGRIGSDAWLGQRKCGDRSVRQPRKPFLFLFGSAEEFERLWNADRLMRREPGHRRAAPSGHQTDGPVVVRGAESETAVLLGNLHAPRAELFESFEEVVVVLATLVNPVRIDVLGQESFQAWQEGVAFCLVSGRLLWERMNQIDVELAQKKIAHERRLFPLGLARRFGDLHRLDGALRLDFLHGPQLLEKRLLHDSGRYDR